MAPEQARGQSTEVGPLADVYALGAILYCLLTGRPPFQAASVMDTLLEVLEKEPLPLSRLNPRVDLDLQTVALKCLEKDPARRYASAQELAEDLGRFLRGEPVHARAVTRLQRVVRWVRRRPRATGLIVVLVAAVLAVAGLAYQMGAADAVPSEPSVLTEDAARSLISEAASISNTDWATLVSSPQAPRPGAIANQSLSLVLFLLNAQQLQEHPETHEDFRYLTSRPRLTDIIRALSVSEHKGYRSFIQPQYITECTVQREGSTAHGTAAFTAPELYSGRVEYVARFNNGAWSVDEFRLPKFPISLERREDGTWGNMLRTVTTEEP
jgi:hypothetical protein